MYNNSVVADLECRFAEGEIVTWEEFYKWIDDILDGFDTHDHSGVSGGGPVLNVNDMTGLGWIANVANNVGTSAIVTQVVANTNKGSDNAALIAALDSRIAALEGAGYATQAYVDNAVAGLASVSWAVLTFYNKTYIDALNAEIDANTGDIATLDSRVDAIELNYATVSWATTTFYNKTYINGLETYLLSQIDTNSTDILDHEGRIAAIELDYATEAWVSLNYYDKTACDIWFNLLAAGIFNNETDIATNDGRITANANDIDACEGRLTTIETTYATESWVTGQGYATTNWVNTNFYTATEVNTIRGLLQDDIDINASDIDACEWDIADNAGDISALDGRVGDIEFDYTTGLQAEGIAIGIAEEHEAACGNWTG